MMDVKKEVNEQILKFRRIASKLLEVDENDFDRIPQSKLKELREMSERFHTPRLDALIKKELPDKTEYECDDGSVLADGLHKDDEIAILRCFMTVGSTFERHHHKSHEYGIVYQGAAEFEINGTTKRVYVGDYVYFPPGVPHKVKKIIKDCKMVFISVPPAKGYPDAR